MKKNLLNRPSIKTFLLVSALLTTLVIQSCYSSTAVKGTPIKDLLPSQDEVMAKRAAREAERQQIAEMSRVNENKVFLEIDSVAEYRIGPLDVLEINSRVGDKVTTATVTVDNRGRISYSFIDDLDATGLTPSQLDDKLTKRLSDFIRAPRIDVLVKEFNSKSAFIMGELASVRGTSYLQRAASGKVYLQGKTSLMGLIAQAGGYTVDADIKNVKLIRGGKSYVVNLYDIIEKGDESLNVIIDDGDVVDIPELPEYGERVYVMGEVNRQGVYEYKNARDLLAAVSLAGSFTSLAREENTLIVRAYEPGEKPLVMMADMNALLRQADLTQNVALQDGDLVYVPRMLIGDINEWIANTIPLLDFLFYPQKYDTAYFRNRRLQVD